MWLPCLALNRQRQATEHDVRQGYDILVAILRRIAVFALHRVAIRAGLTAKEPGHGPGVACSCLSRGPLSAGLSLTEREVMTATIATTSASTHLEPMLAAAARARHDAR